MALLLVASVVMQLGAPTATAAPLSRDEAFVTAAYRDFLGRPPTPGELAATTSTPLTTIAARSQVVSGLSTSPEWIRVTVDKLYQDTLGRPADTGGAAYWVGILRSGRLSVAQVAASFYSSPEYFAGFGHSDVQTWVLDLYAKVLLREGLNDAHGVAYWVSTTQQSGRWAVAYSLYQSSESCHTRVSALYTALLQRAPDPGGWDYWASRVGASGDLVLAAQLASSDEYYGLAWTRFGDGSVPPSAPTGVTATPGDGRATVSWTAPASDGGAPIVAYWVTASPGGRTCITAGATTCVVSGLTNDTAYTFRVVAANHANTGASSAPSAPVVPRPPVTLLAATAPRGVKATPFHFVVPTAGGAQPFSFSVTGLPGGLSIDSATGAIDGTPTTIGIFTASVTVSDAAGTSDTASLPIVVDQLAPTADWLTTLNAYRTSSGLAPVTENPAWTLGITHHLDYLAYTPIDLLTGDYASAHTENPASQWYTADGDAAAHNSNLGGAFATQRLSVEQWLAAPFHAIGLLRPGLTQSAFASKSYPNMGYSAAGIDVLRGLDYGAPLTAPVLFPGPGAAVSFGSPMGTELPDPTESCAANAPEGLPPHRPAAGCTRDGNLGHAAHPERGNAHHRPAAVRRHRRHVRHLGPGVWRDRPADPRWGQRRVGHPDRAAHPRPVHGDHHPAGEGPDELVVLGVAR